MTNIIFKFIKNFGKYKNKILEKEFIEYLKIYNESSVREREIINETQTVVGPNKEICIKNSNITHLKEVIFDKKELNWENYNLEKINLQNIKIKIELIGFNLTDANLFGSDFKGYDYRGVDFMGSDFSECDFRGADFSECDLEKVNMKRANLKNIILSKNKFYLNNSLKFSNFFEINNENLNFYSYGECEELDSFHLEHLKNRKNSIVIFLKKGEFEYPIGIIKTKGDKSFLAIKTILDKNGNRIITTGVVYSYENKINIILKLSKNKKGSNLYKYILQEKDFTNGKFQLQTLRPINCKIIDKYFVLIEKLLDDMGKKRVDFIELN